MRKDLDAFFLTDARRGETLLFYFAGHAATDKGEGHLMGVDAERGSTEGAVSAHALWEVIRASPASRILIVLDACQAGKFVLPEDVANAAMRRKVAFLASTTEESNAGETDRGGLFTQQFVDSLQQSDSVHSLIGAVTVGTAYFYAGGKVEKAGQHTMRAGAAAVLDLPLAWPEEKKSTKLSTGGAAASGRLGEVSARIVSTRLFTIDDNRTEGAKTDRKLVVNVHFMDDADMLRVALYYPPGSKTARPNPEEFAPVHARANTSAEVVVPLRGLAPGKYRVVVQPCGPGKACGNEPPKEFLLDLP
jgi:hypothetical protein